MERHELDIINKYMDHDPELKTLWEAHVDFERQLEKLENRPYRTPSEDLVVKEIKKKKLAGKTKLQLLLDKYKSKEA